MLEGLKGMAESKLDCIGEVIYHYGMESDGVCLKARKEKQGQAKSKQQIEIEKANLREKAAEEAI